MNQQQRNQLTSQEQDKVNELVEEIQSRGKSNQGKGTSTMEQWKKDIKDTRNGKTEKADFNISEKINIIIKELEREKAKPPAIEYREKEVVKLEPKCTKCNHKEYNSKLGQLQYITYGALAYSIITTIMSIIRNELVKNDFKAFLGQVIDLLGQGFKNANKGFLGLASKIDNNIIQWVIHIGLWVLVVGLVGYGIYKLVKEMQYKTWKFWNIGAVGMVLLDLIIIMYLSEPIKNLTKLNLFIFALLLYAAYIIARIVVNVIRAKS